MWPVVNRNGDKLASGIYLCYIKSSKGEKKIIKLMVIR